MKDGTNLEMFLFARVHDCHYFLIRGRKQFCLLMQLYYYGLLIGLSLELVVFDFIVIDVDSGTIFSVSESESSTFRWIVGFLTARAINFSISFWFSSKIFVRSDIISFLRVVFNSSSFSA